MKKDLDKKFTISSVIFFCIVIFVFSFSLIQSNEMQNTVQTSAKVELSNKKVGWGIKRNDNNQQPDLGSKNKELIDSNEDIAMGNNEDKYVYLTFDEGYEAGYTAKILDILKQNNVTGAFFITGHYLNSQPDLVERMINEGHIVGNHTVNHHSMPDLTDDELKEEITTLHTAVYEKFGYEMTYLRPPMGELSERTLSITKSLGYTTVMWSFAYDDWDTSNQRKTRICKRKDFI